MWSYKYTSAKSLFADQCRVGVRFEAAAPAARLVDIFSAASKEQVRCAVSNMHHRLSAKRIVELSYGQTAPQSVDASQIKLRPGALLSYSSFSLKIIRGASATSSMRVPRSSWEASSKPSSQGRIGTGKDFLLGSRFRPTFRFIGPHKPLHSVCLRLCRVRALYNGFSNCGDKSMFRTGYCSS